MKNLATNILALAFLHVYVRGESFLVCNQIEKGKNFSLANYIPRSQQIQNGEKGNWGRLGSWGHKGERGSIDYALLNATIKQHIRELLTQFGKGKRKETSEIRTETAIPANCPILYNDRCFIPKVDVKVTKLRAERMCAKMSGRLANIYDKAHFDMVVDTIRQNYMHGLKIIKLRIGLTIKTEFQLTNGRLAPYLRWHPRTPTIGYFGSNVILQIKKHHKTPKQHLYQGVYSDAFYTLCEIV